MSTGVAARKNQRGDLNVHAHEGNKTPDDYLARPHRNPLDPAGEERIELLQPDNCRNAPEEAVQQVDSAAEIERQATIVPEDPAEDDFREHAADVFIGTADEGSEGEDESIRTVTVIVHDVRCHGDGEPPDNAERPPDETASAHPDTGRCAAEQRFHNIADEGTDDEQQHQLVEAASFGKDIRLRLHPAF